MRQLALVAFLAFAMARGRPVQADSLDSFNKVAICAPVNAKITPGSGYSYQLDADDSVKAALKFTVSGGTLSVETEADFTAQQPIKLTIELPADQLTGVDTRTSDVLVAEGFSSSSGLNVANAGTGKIVLQGARAGSLAIQASGTGSVVADGGRFGAVDLTASGVNKVYLKGDMSSVIVHLSGISEAHLDPTSDATPISGSTTGISKILYTRGQCNLGGSGMPGFPGMAAVAGMPFGNPCKRVTSIALPETSLRWTAGIKVTGMFSCSGGGGASASTSGNGQASATSFSSGGNGGRSSFSSSANGGNVYTSGGTVSNAGNGGNVVIGGNGGNTIERLSTSDLPDAALRMAE